MKPNTKKETKRVNRNKDPYVMILTLPIWLLYWFGTAIMALTVYCNKYWKELEELNK